MNTRAHGFRVIDSNAKQSGSTRSLLFVVIVFGLLLALGAAQWVDSVPVPAEPKDKQAETATTPTTPDFEYFPAQYVNQATEVGPDVPTF
jgi:hypothetical protein